MLPCPLSAGWRLERQLELPRRAGDGQVLGGFSAIQYLPQSDRLWLLSDLPQGSLSLWTGLAQGGTPQLLRRLPLSAAGDRDGAVGTDAEGLVLRQGVAWLVSEADRARGRPAQLLAVDSGSGARLRTLPLPPAWQPGEGRGLLSNGGPESLVLLPAADGTPALLLAAEKPLQQDPPRQVRLLRWRWPEGQGERSDAPAPEELGSWLLPRGENWGLTDLLAVDGGQLLALLRQFEPPERWRLRLALYPLPRAGVPAALAPLASWDLIAAGLTPDNWEGLSFGPPLADGQATLLLVSDDNLSPLQANRLALLVPQRPGCRAPR
ncbi:MAG: esterase-like activity of phytase family protein [Synechococcaceae cyanobacterium]|nr:esterase-like activity of phytase family protein [Synechococcaceae cyanobacterium]